MADPQSNTVPMVHQDTGEVYDIPSDQVPQALSHGLRMGANVKGTDGTAYTIPQDQVPAFNAHQVEIQSGGNGMQAAPARSVKDILSDFEGDLRNGGGHTAVSRLIGQLQGRGDKGMSGLDNGVAPAVGEFIGSPELGATHAVQGAQQIPAHPLTGAYQTLKGLVEAGTLPSMVLGGPGATAAIEAVPSAAHAGQMLGDVAQAAGHLPVPLTRAMTPLERTQQLAMSGAGTAKPADLLYQRAQTINPLSFQEARDFVSNIGSLTRQERAGLNGPMQAALQQLKAGLHGDIRAVADTVGKGEEYANGIKEYAQAQGVKKTFGRVGQLIQKYAIPAAVGSGAGYESYKVLSGK